MMKYKDFMHIDYDLHLLCSSNYVKLQELKNPSLNRFLPTDFRTLAPQLFHSFTNLCKVSNDYIKKSLILFNASSFVIKESFSQETFNLKINTYKDTFISTTTRSFARNLAIILNITWSNEIVSSRRTNFLFHLVATNSLFQLQFSPLSYSKPENMHNLCICSLSMRCFDPMSIYLNNNTHFNKLFEIPGFYTGCLQTESIRHSTLICLFNQSCVDLISFWLNIFTLETLDIHNLYHFSVNSTIESIQNEMFVDRWKVYSSHRAFYEQCRPNYCSYTLIEYKSIWLIITIMLELIGGFMKIMKLILPHFVHYIFLLNFCFCHKKSRTLVLTISFPKFSIRLILRRFSQLNLFSSNSSNQNNERESHDQLLAIRIFLIVFIVSIIILTTYSSQVQLTKTVIISNPSIEQYFSLYKIHSETISCPCENIAIQRKTFISLQATFHQVCQSSSIFGTILSLCQLSFMTVNDGLIDFNAASFVSVKVISEKELLMQSESLIDVFISTSENIFINTLQLVRDTTYANSLLSGFDTSTTVELFPINETLIKVRLLPRQYNLSTSCTCYNDPTCIEPAGIYSNESIMSLIYEIPGIYVACYMVEATLKSNLAFLYNQSEIDKFREII
ncbi:unnamed protein product [Rotaria sp. Silwood1]|nr:unnamed protein product [Rotaria sp. Silwood1]CAF1654703.1 unnamed protein product [Rotaria sp. Silwood1]CAF5025751.1 unnamed protein product [Rotaria sp. Silwood1]